MTWQGLPATGTTDWADWDFRAQFAKAVYERGVACGASGYTLPAPQYTYEDGWDAHGLMANALSIRHLQGDVEGFVSLFLRPIDHAGTPGPPEYYWRSHFWSDAGTPASGRPQEDIGLGAYPGHLDKIVLGGRYAVLNPASGAWAGHDGEIATCTGSNPWTWGFETPADGYLMAWRHCETGNEIWEFEGYYRRDAASSNWLTTTAIGWTRKRPREIERITDDGENGQRARLKGKTGNQNPYLGRYLTVGTAPPETPFVDGYYGVQASATGDWAGQDGKLAKWNGTSWSFYALASGTQILFNSTYESLPGAGKARRNAQAWMTESGAWHRVGTIYEHNGAAWVKAEDQEPAPDLLTLCGKAEHGDYVGPWLFNELQAALQQLYMIGAGPGYSTWGGYYAFKQARSDEGHETWAAAKTQCMDNWTGGADPSEGAEGWDKLPPRCYNWGVKPPAGYAAAMEREHRKHKVMFAAGDSARKCDVRFYIVGQAWDYTYATNVFDAMSDPIGDESAVKWHEKTAQNCAAEFISALWQASKTNTAPQPWCADPISDPAPPGDPTTTLGYETQSHFGIRDHKVTGGFVYQ